MRLNNGELYGPAMEVKTQEEADAQWTRLIEYGMKEWGKPREYVEATMKDNLGYYSGYYGQETMERVQRLFVCSHPVFGKIQDQKELIVTLEQLSEGYLERRDGVIYHRAFTIIRRLDDGNIVVRNPKGNHASN